MPAPVVTADADLLRNLSLAVPVLAVVAALALARHRGDLDPRTGGAAFLATAYAWCGVLVVEAATDLWRFAPSPTDFVGLPLETSLGWALVWGALPALVGGRAWWWVAGFAWVDLTVLPRLDPLVVLGPHWGWGEALLLALVAPPAVVLALTTRDRTHLAVRVGLQVLTFTALVLWVLPTLVLGRTGGRWASLVEHGPAARTALLVAAVVLAVPAASAVVELARVGGGTPFPWDPPDRLVTTGPYAFWANPMQVGATGLLLLLALGTGSWWLLLAGLTAVVFSVVLAERHEQATMARRWSDHAAYRVAVRSWVPRWRAHVAGPTTLWVDQSCGLCRATGAAVLRRAPTGLSVRDAADAVVPLTRMRWVLPGDVAPVVERGVPALARALEQTILPWAWCGWAVRLPVVSHLVTGVADACGLGPRAVGSPVPARRRRMAR